MEANRVEDAVRLARRALDIQRSSLPAGHPTLVPTLATLAEGLLRQQKSVEAKPLVEEALKLATAGLPPGHSQRRRAEAILRQLP
jgi:hypothetical protein